MILGGEYRVELKYSYVEHEEEYSRDGESSRVYGSSKDCYLTLDSRKLRLATTS
jgi:hypothetical protein